MKNKVRQRTKNQTYNNHYQGNNKKQQSSQGQRPTHILSKRVVTKQFCLRVKGYWRKSMHAFHPMTSVLGTACRSTHSCLPGTDKDRGFMRNRKQHPEILQSKVPSQQDITYTCRIFKKWYETFTIQDHRLWYQTYDYQRGKTGRRIN